MCFKHTIFIFVLTIELKRENCTNELLALQLARKENVAHIVSFYGAVIKGRNATIFMELMEGKERLIVAFFMHCGGYHLMLLEKIKQPELLF